MKIKVWGGRGSLPLAENSLYGGNTSCVSVALNDAELLIFDAGSGLVPLGQKLVECGSRMPHLSIFLSHLHWDHIMALPFFAPLFASESPIEVFVPRDPVGRSSEKLWQQMQCCGWKPEEARRCRLKFREIGEGEVLTFGTFSVRTLALNHPALDFGYRVEGAGQCFCYCTDVEPLGETLLRSGIGLEEARQGTRAWEQLVVHPRHGEWLRFLEGADLCLHEAMYSRQEYTTKMGWGHSPVGFVTELAYLARVRDLRLFHYAPEYSDIQLGNLESEAQAKARGFRESFAVALAREGDEYSLS